MKLTLVTNYDDWEGLYKDGQLIEQDHHIRWIDVLNKIGIPVDIVEVNDDQLYKMGLSLPDKLEDVE